MVRKDFLDYISSKKVDEKLVEKINSIYGGVFPELVNMIVSNSKETLFFDDEYRVLSYDEIADAEQDLHVDFKEKKIIPLIDCGENDFIVYHFEDNIWSKFNIIDETVFKKKASLGDLL